MVQRIPTAIARKQFAQVVEKSSRGARIKLTRYNKTQAVIISKEDLAALEHCQENARSPPRKKSR
jgi:PHD/YefM family antitoxin component YafN of YafNO toxin-antitoxin module